MQCHPSLIVQVQPRHLNIGCNPSWVNHHRRHTRPVHSDAVANSLGIAFDTGKPNFEFFTLRQRMNVVLLRLRWRRTTGVGLEWNYLERHSEYLGNFLLEESGLRVNLIAGTPQSAPNHLLTQKLRHERPQPDECVTVLQSQPSVSIPTLTMQRISRPGGCRGRSSFLASSSNPNG